MSNIIQKKLLKELESLKKEGRLAISTIIEGPFLSGKIDLVYEFAKTFKNPNIIILTNKNLSHYLSFAFNLYSENPERKEILDKAIDIIYFSTRDKEKEKFSEISYSLYFSRDFSLIPSLIKELEKKKVSNIDDIRSLLDYLNLTTDKQNIIIFENLDQMNIYINNALLKLLERPTINTNFFILTNNSNALLQTIKSRSFILKTEKINDKKIISEFYKNDIYDDLFLFYLAKSKAIDLVKVEESAQKILNKRMEIDDLNNEIESNLYAGALIKSLYKKVALLDIDSSKKQQIINSLSNIQEEINIYNKNNLLVAVAILEVLSE